MLERIRNKILFELGKLFSPQMIGNYKNAKGKRLPQTRISNTTYIGCKNKLDISDNVFIGHYNFIDACNGITIKEGCQVTNFVSILTHSSHISLRLYGKEYANNNDLKGYVTGTVYIGEYSFIGPHTTIMPNTKIGKGCIVAAYSLVKGEFPDFCVIAGNPAKEQGDTRTMDASFLEANPELRDYYNQWAK